METYLTKDGARVTIDKQNNVFINGECQNPTKYADKSLKENADDWRQIMQSEEEGAERLPDHGIKVTGHLPKFTYTKYDEKTGKPYQHKVSTGYHAW